MRHSGGGAFRRALVHDFQDGLTINFNGDYRWGVTVAGNPAITGDTPASLIAPVRGTITAPQEAVANLKKSVAQWAEIAGALAIPEWHNRTEVEKGGDMKLNTLSVGELGLVIEFRIDQRNPNFQHEDVVSITPPAGTFVRRGGTVIVEINL